MDFGEGRTVTVRKPHRCEWCYEPIPVGSPAYYFHGMWDGDWQNWYMHPECAEAYHSGDDYDDGFMPGEGVRPRHFQKRSNMNNEQIARVCHETNRAYCETIGDMSQKSWLEAEQWQRDSAIKGVEFALANPDAPASAQHDAWLRDKDAEGWAYGPVKDPEKRLHPCMVPYDQLPIEQRQKDYLFRAVVGSFLWNTASASGA